MVGCSGSPQCRNAIWLPGSIVEAAVTSNICSSCNPGPVYLTQFKFRQIEIPPGFNANHLDKNNNEMDKSWMDFSRDSCHVCGKSRWMTRDAENVTEDEAQARSRKKQCPADSLAWKSFDNKYPSFARDSRNVRLGLATDGFNSFKIMSTSYSTYPVILVLYNLPPWICMKQSSFILFMIIPGEKGPRNDIDIYMQPLIEELKKLWEGVKTYDVLKKENFNLRVTLLWTINDFPTYANLSGWSTKGRYACSCCAAQTSSKWLFNGKKFSYMGHCRWLPDNHRFRCQKNMFDGDEEFQNAPDQTTGFDIFSMLKNINFTYGKMNQPTNTRSKKKAKQVNEEVNVDQHSDDESDEEDDPNEVDLWKNRGIFFELPYWKNQILRHNLDVTHIEKNVCENIIGTILNDGTKSKDNLKSRLDLVEMGIQHYLHPQLHPNGKYFLSPSIFSLSKKEKEVFYTVLKDIKVPYRFLGKLKSYCLNKCYPEGSIPEGYGQPLGKVKIAHLDDTSWVQAHRYVLFHHDSIDPFLENAGTRKTRGCITLVELYQLPPGHRVKVSRNDVGQPIGPEARLLSSYLGIVGRNSNLLPINYESWREMPNSNKNQALYFVKEKFSLEVFDDYLKQALRKRWRDHNSSLKKKYLKNDLSLEEKIKTVIPGMHMYQWEDTVIFWSSQKVQDREHVGVASRQQQKFMHTAGSKSFACLANEEENTSGSKVGRTNSST
ncbi:Detected protein of unknown function [Hibiscus syriacus]|uniref:Uncharacterized protein n=1 Tax=Hibiscus syriacus TaxID=106335 RepID=A0A6A3BWS3_HIBSY|nr:Detected protein of unknown function [Hibiscus syriacus]